MDESKGGASIVDKRDNRKFPGAFQNQFPRKQKLIGVSTK
jgi:hypothetical protein